MGQVHSAKQLLAEEARMQLHSYDSFLPLLPPHHTSSSAIDTYQGAAASAPAPLAPESRARGEETGRAHADNAIDLVEVTMDEDWCLQDPEGQDELQDSHLQTAWAIVRSELAACVGVGVECVEMGTSEYRQGRHRCVVALGPAVSRSQTDDSQQDWSAEMVSLVLRFDYAQLRGSEDNARSFERILLKDLCSVLDIEPRRMRLAKLSPLGHNLHHRNNNSSRISDIKGNLDRSTDTSYCIPATVVDLYILSGGGSEERADEIAQRLAAQAAQPHSALSQAQLTSHDMLLRIELHGCAAHVRGQAAEGWHGGRELSVADLLEELVRQAADATSFLSTRTAITGVRAYTGDGSGAVCDARTSLAVARLALKHEGRGADSGLERMLALAHESVTTLEEMLQSLHTSPFFFNLALSHPTSASKLGQKVAVERAESTRYSLNIGREGSFNYLAPAHSARVSQRTAQQEVEEGRDEPSERAQREARLVGFVTNQNEERRRRVSSTSMSSQQCVPLNVQEIAVETGVEDEAQDVVLVFDMNLDDIQGHHGAIA